MNNKLFIRKLFYIGAIAVLLIPLYLLGQPSVKREGQITGGGELAQLRHRYDIGQADIGQIDPASESMRLATLGMRGIASAWLWQKAEYYKEEKYFDRFSATLNQIALLQPHFIKVWESQAHNLSYNVSHEFDDYRQRYAWVKKGIDYLIRGTKYNERQPILQWHLGWYTNHKLGRSDEKTQFRQLYREDDEFHEELISEGLSNLRSEALGADRKPDNWLTGRLWYLKAYDLVASGAIINKNEVHFYAEAPWSQMYYSEAIQEEGVLDDRSRFAWSRANEAWREFGNRDILTSWGDSVQLRSLDRLNQNLAALVAKYDELTVQAKQDFIASQRDTLTADEKFVLDKPESELTLDQIQFKKYTLDRLLYNRFDTVRFVPEDQRSNVVSLVSSIRAIEETIKHTEAYRDQCNYRYWDIRSQAEQSPVTLAARSQVYKADQYIAAADLRAATDLYEKAWLNWRAVFHRYPEMMLETVADDLIKAVNRYLSATDSELNEDFVLYDFMRFRAIRDANRADLRNNEFFEQLLLDAPRWESAMDQPALLENDHIPLPAGTTTGEAVIPTSPVISKQTTPAVQDSSTVTTESPATANPSTPTQPPVTNEPEPTAPQAPEKSSESTEQTTPAAESAANPAAENTDAVRRPPSLSPPQ